MGRSGVIGIDASRLAAARLTGTETYTRQLLLAMAELAPPDSFRLYLNAAAPPPDLPRLGEPVCIPMPRLWTHARLSLEMARRPPGVLFVPAHVVPLVHPRTVVTIHDLGYLVHPEAHPPRQVRMLDRTTRWSARTAERVIAISAATKLDLVRRYGVDPDKISVVHHGVHPAFAPARAEAIAGVRARLHLPARYVLTVGTVQPRKNVARLAVAVASLRAGGEDVRLVVAGKRGWMADTVERDIARAGAGDAVIFLGYVEEGDLPALYSGASAFALPSLYEGFGLPVLEAMACGLPVVTADNSALPEIGGDAALYAPATDAGAIAAQLRAALSDADLRARLIERGRGRAARFTWRATAEATLAVLQATRDA